MESSCSDNRRCSDGGELLGGKLTENGAFLLLINLWLNRIKDSDLYEKQQTKRGLAL